MSDANGDAGREAPAYADSRRLLVESDGKTVRVTVAVSAQLPDPLARGEVQGVGVDFLRTDPQESDYQLFADGGSDGWRAYLQTPEGFVQYPGSFRLGGRVLVFEVPWTAVGGRKDVRVRTFIDWSQQAEPLNKASNDRLPDSGDVTAKP